MRDNYKKMTWSAYIITKIYLKEKNYISMSIFIEYIVKINIRENDKDLKRL